MSDSFDLLAGMAPAGFAALGFVLGMRHATDPDHVIAVTAILTRERRLFAATRIGLVWGLGHSLTVLLVGCAIIVLKIRVPVRLGLTMELGVGVVLILLGLPAAAAVVRGLGARLWPANAANRRSPGSFARPRPWRRLPSPCTRASPAHCRGAI